MVMDFKEEVFVGVLAVKDFTVFTSFSPNVATDFSSPSPLVMLLNP